MKRHLLHFCCLGGLLISASGIAQAAKSPTISRITIRSTDIFDFETKTYLRKFPYTWINVLHIQTKQQVIEQELLFKVGDPVDEFLLQETERNLRALSFIQSARITKFPQRDGSVVIVVFVSDSWTTEPQLNLDGQNKVDTIEVGLREKNFLGLGKRVEFLYAESPSKVERTYRYTDPRFFGSRWQVNGEVVNQTDGTERRIGIDHPFYAADTPWSAGTSHDRTELVFGDFENNVRVSEFEQTKEVNEVSGGLKIGKGRKVVKHAGLRFRNEMVHYTPTAKTTRAIPESEEFQTLFVDLETIRTKYIKIDRVEKMTRVEDYNLGPTVNISPGFSPREITGKDNTDQFSGTYQQRWLIDKTNLIFTNLGYSGREVFDEAQNAKTSAEFRYYHRDFPLQTVVFHTRAEWGNRLDPDNLLMVGAENGLRAYEEDQFVGDRSWVMNLEDRFYFIDDLWDFFSVGAAVFYDSGYAWPVGQTVSFSDLQHSVGAGLRLGLTKSSNEVIIHVDVSYRMEGTATDNDHVVVTFGTGQAF